MRRQRKFWALAWIVTKHPNIVLCPTLFQTGEGSTVHEKITRHKYSQITAQMTLPTRNTKQDKTQKGQGSSITSYTKHQRKTPRNSRGCLLYSPPCASKNHPQGQYGASHSPYEPACGHVHCVEGKRRFFKKKNRRNHILISLSYKTISPGNALKVS